VVDDQRGAPTYAADLAEGIVSLAHAFFGGEPREADAAGAASEVPRGLFHLSNSGETTWHAFAREILDRTGHGDLAVEPITTAALGLPAPRPAYSVLDCSRAAAWGVRLRDWREGLAAYLRSAALGPAAVAPTGEGAR
jgi:dTDP-4-dehydrorhamnose reductase